MTMEFFKAKSDLIHEISLLEMQVDVLKHFLKDKDNDLKQEIETNNKLNQEIENLKQQLKNIKFTNKQQTLWR